MKKTIKPVQIRTVRFNENIALTMKPLFTHLNEDNLTINEYIHLLEYYQDNEIECTPEHVIACLSVMEDVEAFGAEIIDANENVLDEEVIMKSTFAVKVNNIDNGFKQNIWYIVIVNDMIQCVSLVSKR